MGGNSTGKELWMQSFFQGIHKKSTGAKDRSCALKGHLFPAITGKFLL